MLTWLLNRLIEPVEVALPTVPAAAEGLRLAHLSDLHLHGRAWRDGRLIRALEKAEADVLVLTGDCKSRSHSAEEAAARLENILSANPCRLGAYGVFGNHDDERFRAMVAGLPIRWLINEVVGLPELPVHLFGVDCLPHQSQDAPTLLHHVATSMGHDHEAWPPDTASDPGPFRLMLAHKPTTLPIAADLGMHLMLSGHTHGGQLRLPGGIPLRNATDMPLSLSAGRLRHRHTEAWVTRGLGEVAVPLRTFCPVHVPVYRLHQAEQDWEPLWTVQNLSRW